MLPPFTAQYQELAFKILFADQVHLSSSSTLSSLYSSIYHKAQSRCDSRSASSTLRGLINTKCDGTTPRPRASKGKGNTEQPWNRTRLLRSGRYYPASTWPAWVPPLCVTQSKSLTLSSYWQRSPINPVQVPNSPVNPLQGEQTLHYLFWWICNDMSFFLWLFIMFCMCCPKYRRHKLIYERKTAKIRQ